MKIVIALGGNALGNSPNDQLESVKKAAKSIVDIIERGNDVIVTHGNGPQVGMINDAMEMASENNSSYEMPFAECGAMSQGYIGYHLEQAIQNELKSRNIDKNPVTIITEVEVDKNDMAFDNPTKPIGLFYTKEEADRISLEKGYQMKEDSGRGYRRVVPSPLPIKIDEEETIDKLFKAGTIIITCGGGGIPVIRENDMYKGIAAVIDKDRTSALLAKNIDADLLLILTTVDKIAINYEKPDQKWLTKMTTKEAREYILEKQFAEGSMLPKVEACLEFVKGNKKAIITSLQSASRALDEAEGTVIVEEGGEV